MDKACLHLVVILKKTVVINGHNDAVQMRSRGASLAPSRAASRAVSRATSPVLSATSAAATADDTALPLVLCNLLQQEFSGTHSPGKHSGSNSFRRRIRPRVEDQEDQADAEGG